jgi:hypothetical protein
MVRASVADGPDPARTVRLVVFLGSFLVVLLALTDGARLLAGQSASTWQLLFLCSIPPFFLSCFRVCFKKSFLRLEVDP